MPDVVDAVLYLEMVVCIRIFFQKLASMWTAVVYPRGNGGGEPQIFLFNFGECVDKFCLRLEVHERDDRLDVQIIGVCLQKTDPVFHDFEQREARTCVFGIGGFAVEPLGDVLKVVLLVHELPFFEKKIGKPYPNFERVQYPQKFFRGGLK